MGNTDLSCCALCMFQIFSSFKNKSLKIIHERKLLILDSFFLLNDPFSLLNNFSLYSVDYNNSFINYI